jgi:ubiquitin C-terminal hydrolase
MRQPPPLTDDNVIDVYIGLVQSMWSGRHECVTPRKLKDIVSRSAPIFSDYGQKDSHEFMNSLLNAIQNVDSNSFLVNLFQINTQSKTTCNKHQHADIIDEITTFLPLPLPQIEPNRPTTLILENLIADFCEEDELTGQYYCQKCDQCLSARQKTTIIQPLPRALVIQLKRFPFDNTNRKIDTLVQYKLEYRNLLSNNDKYELCAVSLHSGSLSGGHYTTMARNYKTKTWHRFDDSYIEEIDSKNVVAPFIAQQAYILVYLKKDD